MSENKGEVIPYLEFLNRTKKPALKPAAWRWKDIYPKLMDSVDDDFLGPGRGGVSLVHKDIGDGVSPALNVVVQLLKPGESNEAHRHSNVALFLVLQGEGYSTIDGEKIDWEKGDLVLAPAWSDHGHHNTSETEDAILVTFQDVPLMTNLGTMFLEEPVGDKPRHIVGNSTKPDTK